ncbi:MAG: DUF4166 domain-containing protein [Hyphomicrobiaceae bacterium]
MVAARKRIKSGTSTSQDYGPSVCADTRFRTLLGPDAWSQLPPPVQNRFSRVLAPGEMKLYEGEVVSTELSRAGAVLAFVLRVIGAPLPLQNGAAGASVVSVIEDPTIGGQLWSRSYAREGKFPQVVHSAKRFRGHTGLEEYVGAGLGMALRLSVRDGALVFSSSGYFFESFGRRIWLPEWMTPGAMEIVHTQLPDEKFSFRLTLLHPVFGRVLDQIAFYRDVS